MSEILENVKTNLASIPGINYVDEDWGQLDLYSPAPPVKFPCILIDIINNTFSNIGIDKQAEAQNRQMSAFTLQVRIAELRLTNTSARAPLNQRNQARHIFDLMEDIHVKLQGHSATSKCSKFLRTSSNRVQRDDGVREYVMLYSANEHNV
jgi:hypothetical protein